MYIDIMNKSVYNFVKGVDNMTNKISNVSFRIDSDLKKNADELFAELGLNMTTAFNIFLRQAVREGRIPFDITLYSPKPDRVLVIHEPEKNTPDLNQFVMSSERGKRADEYVRELRSDDRI